MLCVCIKYIKRIIVMYKFNFLSYFTGTDVLSYGGKWVSWLCMSIISTVGTVGIPNSMQVRGYVFVGSYCYVWSPLDAH